MRSTTVIRFGRDSEECEIYTSDTTVMTKLDKLASKNNDKAPLWKLKEEHRTKARGNYGGKKKENNISIPSVTKRTAKTITKAEKASNASNAQTTTPPEEESSKEPDHKQLSNLSLSNSIDKKAKNTTPPDLKPDTNFINKENISKNTESASYDEKNMEKDAYHEKEMLPEKEEDLHTSSASETFENSGSESFGDNGFDLFSSIENLI